MTHTVVGENKIRTLTIPHVKMFINAEWNAFVKFIQKESHGHHAEASFNEFCQFINDSCALKIKRSISDRRCRHNNAVALLFRKSLSSKADKVPELFQDTCTEVPDKNFVDIFASSVQDLAANKVEVELNAENEECDMHQGDKVGSIAFGELTRSKDKY